MSLASHHPWLESSRIILDPDQATNIPLDNFTNLCYIGCMRFKYKKGDVLKFTDSMFYIQGFVHKNQCYQVFVLEGFNIEGGRLDNDFPSKSSQSFNRGFVEKHCTLVQGATAQAIKVLYGDSEH